MPRSLAASLFPVLALPAFAQVGIRDTTIRLTVVTASYSYQLPGGDMAVRFGANSNIGLGALHKTRGNYLLGVEGSFLFGNKVFEPGLLRNVITREGQIVDKDGAMADVQLYERGYTVLAVGGKIIPVVGPNPNSGMLLKFGAGYMRHKIRIQTQAHEVPQLEGDYLEGYDRLCAGPAVMLYVGYQHFGSRGRINFQFGFETLLGFTEPLRAYNFDTRQADSGTRFDQLMGLRAGWSLPIYKKPDDRFHYY